MSGINSSSASSSPLFHRSNNCVTEWAADIRDTPSGAGNLRETISPERKTLSIDIHTGLQPGDERQWLNGNRFNGFSVSADDVNALMIKAWWSERRRKPLKRFRNFSCPLITGLKPGVNEILTVELLRQSPALPVFPRESRLYR